MYVYVSKQSYMLENNYMCCKLMRTKPLEFKGQHYAVL